MKSLPNKYFGPDGLPCVFALDNDGTPSVGYLVKQHSNYKFLVSDGTNTRVVNLAQTEEDVSSYTTFMPPGKFTILIQHVDGPIEYVKRITYDHVVTITETMVFQWHNAAPTEEFHGIIVPDLTPPSPPGGMYIRLLEDGNQWLLEDNTSNWLLETSVNPDYLMLETGSYLLLEDGGDILLEIATS